MSTAGKVTTHVLDVAAGRPAAAVAVTLERRGGSGWDPVASGFTDADGRLLGLTPAGSLVAGVYRLSFDVGAYYRARQTPTFYGQVPLDFLVADAEQHYHVPLLLSPFGYSTYRGS